MTHLIKAITPLQRIVIASICVVGLAWAGFAALRGATKEREAATMPTKRSTREVTIPPIDASAPTQTETATFALG